MMDQLLQGFITTLAIGPILWMLFGWFWGIFSGAMPGITSSVGMALLLPLTWTMDVSTSLATLAGVWAGSAYGGGIPAILINTPGTPGAAATTLDGYMLHTQGQSGKALGVSLVCGTVGGIVSVFALLMVVPLSAVVVAFGPAEYFGLAVFGLTIISSLSTKNMLKGVISGVFGLLLATIGADTYSATIRFGMGLPNLVEGPPLVPVVIGLFAVAEMLRQVSFMTMGEAPPKAISTTMPNLRELLSTARAKFIGLVSGLIIGLMPGAGQTVSAFVAYSEAKRWSKHPEKFGKGSLEGVAAPETANNCTQGGDMVPALALGIPGSSSAAIMMAGLMLHGIQPGPMLFQTRPDITFNLCPAMIVVNVLMLPAGYICIRVLLRAIMVPVPYVVAGVLTLVTVGCYSVNSGMFEVGVAFLFGVIGFFLNRFGFSVPSVVLGLVLGRLLETSFRRALILSDGDWMTFIERPISALLIGLALLVLVYPLIRGKKRIGSDPIGTH